MDCYTLCRAESTEAEVAGPHSSQRSSVPSDFKLPLIIETFVKRASYCNCKTLARYVVGCAGLTAERSWEWIFSHKPQQPQQLFLA